MTRAVLILKTITETGDHDHYSSFDIFTSWSLNNYNSIANLATILKVIIIIIIWAKSRLFEGQKDKAHKGYMLLCLYMEVVTSN